MAQKYLVQVIDDLDGSELTGSDAEQVRFGLDGVAYVIDLSSSNAAGFRDTLRQYVDAARRADLATGTTRSRPSGGNSRKGVGGKRSDLDAVRAWANANDRPVSSRGRVPAAILGAYDATH